MSSNSQDGLRLIRGRTEKKPTPPNPPSLRRFSDGYVGVVTKLANKHSVRSMSATSPQISEALICAICLHLLDEQFKVLDCGHSYCFSCLQRCLESKARRSRGSISCPKCKQVTNLPEGVEGLKTNYDLKAVREVIAETTNRKVIASANACLPGDKIGNAQMNLQDATEQYQQYLKESKELVRGIKDTAKTVEYDINEHFKAIVTVLDEQKKRLLHDVEEIRSARIGKVEEDRSKAEKTIKRFKECRENLKKLDKMKPTEDEYEAQIKAMCTESEAMASNRPAEIIHDLAWMEYVTAAGSMQSGRLKTDRTIELTIDSEFGGGWLFKLAKARGIAVTKKGLIAVTESNASKLSVWEEVKGEYQRKFYLKTPWNIQGLNKPTDVAVIAGEKFVVVDAANTIKVFSATGEYDPNEMVKEEGTTCVTSDPRLEGGMRILMDSREDIARFDASGFVLPPIIAGTVSHAIATNGKNVAISNLKEVNIFDVNSGEKLLNFEARVRGLCFDDETNSILATTCDRQIGQFCASTGQLLAIISEEVLSDPWGLVIIPGRRLAVADDQTVKVYRIIDS